MLRGDFHTTATLGQGLRFNPVPGRYMNTIDNSGWKRFMLWGTE